MVIDRCIGLQEKVVRELFQVSCILPQLDFDSWSDQGVTEPKKEVLSKARKTNSTSTLGTSANTWLVKRKTAKGKLVRRELLKKFMLVNSVRSQHSDDY